MLLLLQLYSCAHKCLSIEPTYYSFRQLSVESKTLSNFEAGKYWSVAVDSLVIFNPNDIMLWL